MKDRYLFRGKRLDNGEWVYGNLIRSNDSEVGYEAIIIPTNDSNMYTKGGSIGDLGFENWHRVNETTICQCTGLKCKNGNLIWENDILKNLLTGETAPIRYGSYKSCFNSEKKEHVGFYVDWSGIYSKNYRKDLGYWIHVFGVKIIGTVFDDREPLEE